MEFNRREFLCAAGCSGLATCLSGQSVFAAVNEDSYGVLVDIPNCIGCRKCEFACRKAAGFPVPPMETFEDKAVFAEHRRPSPRSYTMVNAFGDDPRTSKPVYVKVNCLHCNEPACASACLVGALKKQPKGAVTYDASKCMGCRYCMVACPFQIPTYDYDNPLTPQVRKCTFCFDITAQNGNGPACVKICPNDALVYGKRKELLALAHDKINSRPDLYVNHVYGEQEAGGTSWLYISGVPFEKLRFPTLGGPPSKLTEEIQHAVFKYFVPPLALYAILGMIMRQSKPESLPAISTSTGADESAAQDNGRCAMTEQNRQQERVRYPAQEECVIQ